MQMYRTLTCNLVIIYVVIIDLVTNKVESKIDLNATGNRLVLKDRNYTLQEPFVSDTKYWLLTLRLKAVENSQTIGSDLPTELKISPSHQVP